MASSSRKRCWDSAFSWMPRWKSSGRCAGNGHDIENTVDYGVAFAVIEKIVVGQRRYMIEALANDIAKALRARYPQIVWLKITVRKPSAPVPGILDYAQVSVEHRALRR